ncbi:hypothetical protein ACFVIM_11305 [Streptomyces sp. NPDC057638]|uniref:hypothetical protein n=1 Tax=Streptomyces sp. NPDC057638 TaxID=3346190 RepID=UPI0036A7D680
MTRSKRTLPPALVRAATVFVLTAGVTASALTTAPMAVADGRGEERPRATDGRKAEPNRAATDRREEPTRAATDGRKGTPGDAATDGRKDTPARTATDRREDTPSRAAALPGRLQATLRGDGRLSVLGLDQDTVSLQVRVLRSRESGVVLGTFDELTWNHIPNTGGWNATWDTVDPVRLPPGTPAGSYPVEIVYRQPGGPELRDTNASVYYSEYTAITSASWDRAYTDYDHRTLTLSGTAETWDPELGRARPAAEGTPVNVTLIDNGNWGHADGAVGADGRFAIPYTPRGAITRTSLDGLPTVPIRKMTYRLTADYDRLRLRPGGEFTVTGRAERLTDDGWKPFTGASVRTSDRGGVRGQGTVAADGTFTYPATAGDLTRTVTTEVKPSPYFQYAGSDGRIIYIPVAATLTHHKITLDPYGTVKARAVLNTPKGCGTPRPLNLQYSPDGKKWSVLRTGATTTACAISIEAPGKPSGYYRFQHPETNQHLELTGPAVHQVRVPTRITSAKLTPARPERGGKLTATGTLQRQVNGGWNAHPGAKLVLSFKARGSDTWRAITTGTAGRTGGYSLKGTVPGDGSWRVETQIAAGYLHTETKVTYVDAR